MIGFTRRTDQISFHDLHRSRQTDPWSTDDHHGLEHVATDRAKHIITAAIGSTLLDWGLSGLSIVC